MTCKKNVLPITTGKQLSRYRKELGLTQPQLAESLGCSYETISNYERGVTEITPFIGTYLRYYFTYGPFPPGRQKSPTRPLRG